MNFSFLRPKFKQKLELSWSFELQYRVSNYPGFTVGLLHLIFKGQPVLKSLILFSFWEQRSKSTRLKLLSCLMQTKGQRLQNTCEFHYLSSTCTLNSIFWLICIGHHNRWQSSDCTRFNWKVLSPVMQTD
jgi:hypothetical protein